MEPSCSEAGELAEIPPGLQGCPPIVLFWGREVPLGGQAAPVGGANGLLCVSFVLCPPS